MTLSADAILGAEDVQTRNVPVPEWGGEVTVRGLTGIERDAYEAGIQQIRPKPDGTREVVFVRDNARAKLLVKCLVDEQGNRIFKDNDAPALGKKNGAVIDRLYDVAAELSGLSEQAQKDIEGNSEGAQSADSPSSSPETSDAPELNS